MDFTTADLADLDLPDVDLQGVQWSALTTRWPSAWEKPHPSGVDPARSGAQAEDELYAAAHPWIGSACQCSEKDVRRAITNGLRLGIQRPRQIPVRRGRGMSVGPESLVGLY
jgi:hypothetical protein